MITKFSKELTILHGSGLSITNISYAISFYSLFPSFPTSENWQYISWSQCREIIPINNIQIINFYIREIVEKELTIRKKDY